MRRYGWRGINAEDSTAPYTQEVTGGEVSVFRRRRAQAKTEGGRETGQDNPGKRREE
jgi:hypothetical protein